MKALLFALFLISPSAFAVAPDGYVTETRELTFKPITLTQFYADTSKIDYAGGLVSSGSAKFFGGLEVLPGSRVHLRIAGLLTGREATFPAHVARFSDGTVLEIVIPAQAFRFWNKPDRLLSELNCVGDGKGGLACYQDTYVRKGTFGF